MGSAVLKSTRERMDVRNMLFGGKGMLSATGQKMFGPGYSALSSGATGAPSAAQAAAQSSATSDLLSSSERQEALLRVVAKNTFNMNMMARDMNITRQNIATMTRLAAGKSAQSQDAMWYDVKTRNQSIDSLGKKTPTKAGGSTESKGSGIFGLLGGLFSGGANLLGAVVSGLLGTVGAIGGGILSTIGSVLKFIPGGFLIGTIALAGVAYLIKKVSENVDFSKLKDDILKGLGLDPDDKENSLTKQILMKLGFSEGTSKDIEKKFNIVGEVFSNMGKTFEIYTKAAFSTLSKVFTNIGSTFADHITDFFANNKLGIIGSIAVGLAGAGGVFFPPARIAAMVAGLVAGGAIGKTSSAIQSPESLQQTIDVLDKLEKLQNEANDINSKIIEKSEAYRAAPLFSDERKRAKAELDVATEYKASRLPEIVKEINQIQTENVLSGLDLEGNNVGFQDSTGARRKALRELRDRIVAERKARADFNPMEYFRSQIPADISQSSSTSTAPTAGAQSSTAPTQVKIGDKIHGLYPVTSGHGERVSPTDRTKREFHKGADVALVPNHPLTAAVDGEVIAVGKSDIAGNFISIKDADGNVYSYSHLNSSKVIIGAKVKRGDVIGLSGSTGRSTGPHLHFDVKDKQGNYRSPTLEELKNAISPSEKISALSIENMDQRRSLMAPDAGGGTTVVAPQNTTVVAGGKSQAFAGAIDAEALYLFT